MKVKIIKVIFSIVLGMLVLTSCGKDDSPEEKQLKADFTEKKLSDDKMSISKFSVDSEQKGETQYKAIVSVVYDNKEVEYEEKYHFTYDKYDEWILNKIEEYEKKTWTKRPISVPTIEYLKNICEDALYENGEYLEYDTFEPITNKTEKDLDKEEVIFIYKVNKETKIETISGEINFFIKFDEESEKWIVDSYSMDSLKTEFNFINTWSGKGSHMGEHISENDEEKFGLKVTSYENGKANAILSYNNKDYKMSGTITIPESDSVGGNLEIDLVNEKEKMHIDGFMTIEGEMTVTVDTAYIPDALLYRPVDRYGVNLYLK